MLEQKEIPECHESIVRAASGTTSGSIPERVVDIYWDLSRTLRKVGLNVTEREIALVCVLAGMPSPDPPVSFLNAIEEYGIAPGDKVLVKFRKKWRWAIFSQLKDGKVVAQIEDDLAEDREFLITNVRVPSLEEKQSLLE